MKSNILFSYTYIEFLMDKKNPYQSCSVPLYFPGSQAAIEIFSKIGESTKLNSFLLTT